MSIDLRNSDSFCSRIFMTQSFPAKKDIYLSFQTPQVPRLITESSDGFVSTEDGDVIIVNSTTNVTIFLVRGSISPDTSPDKGDTGIGTGILALTSTGKNNIRDHVASVSLDFYGGYGLKNAFKDGGDKGNFKLIPNSITARISSDSSEIDFLSTVEVENFDILTTNFKTFKISFKEHLNRIVVERKNQEDEIYESVFDAETFFKIKRLPEKLRIGIAASGNARFSIKDPTYSFG